MPRLFYAVHLPSELQEELTPAVQSLKQFCSHARPVPKDSLHLTLLFLGEQPESTLPDFFTIGSQVVSTARPCNVALGPVGFFPKVSFLTLTGEFETLALISHSLLETCQDYLEQPEERPFKPHITLARHKQNIRPTEKEKIRETFAPFVGRSWVITEMVLFESELSPKGPKYTALRRFHFSG